MLRLPARPAAVILCFAPLFRQLTWRRAEVLLLGAILVLAADRGFAALELLAALARRGVTCVTRLRLDAALYGPAPPRGPE